MTTFDKRLKHGLRWSDHRPPGPTLKETLAATLAGLITALLIVLGYLFVSYQDAQAGMIEAQASQIKAEVALVTILNGDPLIIDKDSGAVALARVEVYGEPK